MILLLLKTKTTLNSIRRSAYFVMKTPAGELAFTVGLPGFRHQLQLVLAQELAETLRSKICLLICVYVYCTRSTPRISFWLLGSPVAMLQIVIENEKHSRQIDYLIMQHHKRKIRQ